MKQRFMLLFVAFTLAATALGETAQLELRVAPERDCVLKTKDAEIVFDVNLRGRNSETARHAPINLALVLDRSGSMSGAKIEKARQAACDAIDQLQPADTFSLVDFDDNVEVLIPAQHVEDPQHLKDIVNRIEPGGSTGLYAGVREGDRQLRKYFDEKNVNRIILVSDGIANVGPSSPGELAEMARGLREHGAAVTTVGLGDDYNENTMVAMAEASGANYYYVKDAEKLPGIFAQELGQVKNVVAQNLRVIIELPEGVEGIGIIGLPDVKFQGNKATVKLGDFYGSQRRDLLVRCRLKEPEGEAAEIGRVHLAYAAPGDGQERNAEGSARVQFTKDRGVAEKSMNRDVATQAALATNSESRARALALQDAGKFKEAGAILKEQAGKDAQLGSVLGNAKLSSEAAALGGMAGEFEKDRPLGNSARKAFHYENYNQANQKGD